MRFALSEDQTLLQDSLNRALADLVPLDRVRRFAGDEGPQQVSDIWMRLAELGLPGLMIPEEHGGLGLGMMEAALASEALIANPVFRDRLMQLQGRILAMKFNGLRLLTSQLTQESVGIAGLIVKLQGCELNHQLAALAIDALGELGILYHDGPHLRAKGRWQWNYMFDLGLIIGGGTAQIQKNIISERGLGMPREPKAAKV